MEAPPAGSFDRSAERCEPGRPGWPEEVVARQQSRDDMPDFLGSVS